MKKIGQTPRFLPEIVQALYELKEIGGSNSNKIVSHVKSNLKGLSLSSTPRNLSTQVRRALNHATTNGIVKQRAGKFRINAAFLRPFKNCMECRRRKRMEKKRSKRRKRRRTVFPTVRSLSKVGSDSETPQRKSDSESDEYPVRLLRRTRRSKRVRRRRRRRRSHSPAKVEAPVIENDNKETFSPDAVYPDDHRNNDLAENQCDNPECLCNVKDESEDPPM